MGLKIKLLSIAILLLSFISIVEAAWEGPVDVISGVWGSGTGQFGLRSGDGGDTFPLLSVITPDGKIVVTDSVNKKQLVFSVQGSFIKDVQWIVKSREGGRTVYDVPEYSFGPVVGFSVDGNIYTSSENKYFLVSPTGQLIRTSTTRPLELGYINETRISGGKYKYTLKYPDGTYTLISDTIFEEGLMRDQLMNLYGIGTIINPQDIYVTAEWEGNTVSQTPQPHYIVSRFSPCGKLQGRVDVPADNSKFKKTATGVIRDESLLRQYGKPVVAPNGDVYTWQRTSTSYSILKWTWVDDPNVPTGPDAPTGLSVIPSINGLYLTWTASPQDPGCVTGYEIARATSSGGVFSTVGTVDKGVVKYNDTTAETGTMYYYKVRAKAGTEYSPYTAEVSGKR